MSCKILCLNKKPKHYDKLFFGDYGGLNRVDKVSYHIFKKLAETDEANVWFTKEIDCTKDKKGWDSLPENAKSKFHKNVLYQTNLDSAVPNIFFHLSMLSTDTWLTYLYARIGTMEELHSNSYSTGLDQMFREKATEMIDYIYEDKVIQKRTEKEINDAELFLSELHKNRNENDNLKKALLQLLVRVYFLEGVKFPFSFFVTWAINKAYNNGLQGFSQLLKLIAHDEMTVHTTTGQQLLTILMKDKKHGFYHLKEWFNVMVYDIAKETAELEFKWNEYLLEDGEIPGYNKLIGEHFIKYWVDYRLKALKLNPIYNEEKSDIINWFNEYRQLNKTQVALQEADNTNYQKGQLKNDLHKFDNFVA